MKLAADLLEQESRNFWKRGFQGFHAWDPASRLSVTTGHCTAIIRTKEISVDAGGRTGQSAGREIPGDQRGNFADQPVKDQVQTLPEIV